MRFNWVYGKLVLLLLIGLCVTWVLVDRARRMDAIYLNESLLLKEAGSSRIP